MYYIYLYIIYVQINGSHTILCFCNQPFIFESLTQKNLPYMHVFLKLYLNQNSSPLIGQFQFNNVVMLGQILLHSPEMGLVSSIKKRCNLLCPSALFLVIYKFSLIIDFKLYEEV